MKKSIFKEIDKGIDGVEENTGSIKWWTIINTVFTIISGTALLVLAILEFIKGDF